MNILLSKQQDTNSETTMSSSVVAQVSEAPVIQYYNPCYEKPERGVYNPPLNRDFTALDVYDIDDQTMYKIIGKDGIVFKAISHQTNVDYIFWLKEEKLIAVWGFTDCIQNALNRLSDRVKLIVSNTSTYDNEFPAL